MPIRPAVPEDAPGLLAIYAPYVEHTAVSFEYTVPDAEEFARRIRETLQHYPYLVAEEDGVPLGYAYAAGFHHREAYHRSVEVSIYVAGDRRRAGIGRALYRALEAELAARGILNLYACIAAPRGADPYLTEDSQHFHRRMGYDPVARFHACGLKFGRWYDIVWMEKMLGDHPMPEA